MDVDELRALQREVQACLQRALDHEMQPGHDLSAPLPWCFGSQRYCLTGPKSDVDLLVLCPAGVASPSPAKPSQAKPDQPDQPTSPLAHLSPWLPCTRGGELFLTDENGVT